jgi:hypothetical protein
MSWTGRALMRSPWRGEMQSVGGGGARTLLGDLCHRHQRREGWRGTRGGESPIALRGEGRVGGRALFLLLVDRLAYMFHSIRFRQNRKMEYFFIYLRKFPQY